MRHCVVLGGRSHPELVARICSQLDVEQADVETSQFSNGEVSVKIGESVREKHVYVVQTASGEVNTSFMELLIMISACKSASAQSVTAVLPLFPYSRQVNFHNAVQVSKHHPDTSDAKGVPPSPSRPSLSRNSTTAQNLTAQNLKKQAHPINEPQYNSGYKYWIAESGPLIAQMLQGAGADNIITMDLHDAQYQGFFDIPMDNLYGRPLIEQYISQHIPNHKEAVIVSPDAGGAKRATALADHLGVRFALIHKDIRNNATILVGNVKDRVAVIIDDLVDTARTMVRASKLVKDHGATEIWAICSHGIFSRNALEHIQKSPINHLVTTNSVPQTKASQMLADRFQVIDVSQVFGEAIRRIHNGESISMAYDHALNIM